MGAMVELLRGDATAIATAFTDDRGRYLLNAVLPGSYQMRASAAFLVPTTRSNLILRSGARVIVNLTMSTLFETEGWLPAQKRRSDEPADDWKWALRSTANRPLLRLVDPTDHRVMISTSATEQHASAAQTRVLVTNGDGAFGQGGVHQVLLMNRTMEDGDGAILRADIGNEQSPFTGSPSVETSVGYEQRSVFTGNTRLVSSYQTHPELSYGEGQGMQVLRLASTHQMSFGDVVMVDAGTLLEAERLSATRITSQPYVRVMAHPGSDLTVEYRYAAGRSLQSSEDLDHVKPTAELLTDAAGRPLSAKGSHHELSASHKVGPRTVSMAVYRDEFSNAALEGSGYVDRASLDGIAMITDPTTGAFLLAAPGYADRGASGSVVQPLTASLEAWVEYDLGTALRMAGAPVVMSAAGSSVSAHTTSAGSAALRGKILRTGTSLKAEYRWQPLHTLTQVNAYNARSDESYLGFYIRQRVWCGRRLPSGIDAVVQATNLLAQGYEPMLAPDGHTLFLAEVPRAIKGGLAFNF
jgi:hypothetical protein